jgi:hypothetical protein
VGWDARLDLGHDGKEADCKIPTHQKNKFRY